MHASAALCIIFTVVFFLLAYCEPGSISDTRFPPCTACDEGYYQLNFGSKSCEKCLPTDYMITTQCTTAAQYNTTTAADEQILPSPSNEKQIKPSNTDVLQIAAIAAGGLIG